MLLTGVERHEKLLDSCLDGLAGASRLAAVTTAPPRAVKVEAVGEAHTLVLASSTVLKQERWLRCMARAAVSWRRTQFISRWRMARVGAW